MSLRLRRPLRTAATFALLGPLAGGLLAPSVRAAGTTNGTISLTTLGSAYTQDFNSLANFPDAAESNALPLGWALEESGSSTTRNDGNYTVGSGSSNTGDAYSYGFQAGATDRAYGMLRSSALVPIIGASFSNATGATITELTVNYTGEQWRLGASGRGADRIDFQISSDATGLTGGTWTDVNGLDFSSPISTGTVGVLNGNLAANRTVVSASISGLSIPSGATFWIRWTDFDVSNADDGLAVDDLSLVPRSTATPTNPTVTGAANPASVSAGGSSLLTATVVPGTNPASTGLAVSAELGAIGGSASQPFFDDGTNGDQTAGDNVFSFQATVAPGTAPGVKSLPLTVSDAQGRSGTGSIGLTVLPPALAIHEIQGSGSTSPYAGQTVSTTGIVTGIKQGSGGGFFIQTPDADADADPNTSEGVFVFTGSARPAAAVIGNAVSVTATVQEFKPSADLASPPVTELTGATTSVISTGNTLPAPITLTAADTSPSGSIEQLERFEGMRVHVESLTVVAPTQGFINEASASSTSNGTFYGVISGIARPFREPGLEVPDPLPPGAPCCIPRFDGNPERLRVDSDAQPGSVALEVTSGATVTNLVGPFDYGFRSFTILPDAATPPVASGNVSVVAVPVPGAGEFTVASFNMERFYDTVNDPLTSDVTLSTAAFEKRLQKASLLIRHVMRNPDIVGIEEMENLTTLETLATRIGTDAVAAGEPDPQYQAYLVEGNDIGGIDVGFLVKSPRVSVIDVTQVGKSEVFCVDDSATPPVQLLNDRPSLVLRATVQPPSGAPYPVTVIVNHLRSLSGINSTAPSSCGFATDGERVRAKRRAQAEFLAGLIQARQAADPNEHIVSVGDYNAFQFNDGYVDPVGTIKGAPTPADQVALASDDLVNPDLVDLVDVAPADQRYSFLFDGNAQELDHVLVTANMLPRVNGLHYARVDSDFPETYRGDATRPERLSDHDPLVATFSFPSADLTLAKTGSPDPVLSGTTLTYAIPVANGMADTALDLVVTDPLPGNTAFRSVTAPEGWSCQGPQEGASGTVVCSASSQAPQTTAVLSLAVDVECTLPNGTTLTNSATVTSSTYDPDPTSNTSSWTSTVSNPPPVVTAPDDASYQCSAEVPVPDAAQALVSDNCGTPDVSVSETSNGGSGTPASPLVLTRLYGATDSAGGSGSDSQTITVADTTAPLVSLAGDSTMTVECHGHFEDPGATASDNCGGDLSSQISVSGSVDVTVPGTYTLVYSVRDAAGNLGSATRTVQVVDTEAPTLVLLGDNPLTVECHTAYRDPGAVALDECGGDLGPQIVVTGGVNTEVPGVYTVTYTVSDKAGNTVSANRTVVVVATPPEVTITGPESGAIFAVGTPVTFSGSFTDRDTSGHTAVWTVGGTSLTGTVDEAQGTVSATHIFTTAGVYRVTLTVTDACGAAGTANTVNGLEALVVIYDPSAGFVTGGGFIDSPPGADVADPALTGKANFGFVSRYQGGAQVPSGQTEFQFKAGGLNFHGSAYDWLVVSGPLAQYTGTGTLNGAGSFGFVVTVLDGQSNGGGGVDRLRMKIWDETTGALVYDTQPGAADGAVPTAPLAGGSIVIHN